MAIKWILLLILLFPSLSVAAPTLSERDWQILKNIARNGGAAGITLGTEQPLTCTPGTGPNAFFLDTDTGTLSFCSQTDTFLEISTGQIVTLDGAFDNGSEIDNATSANPVKMGDGVRKLELGGDATLGAFIRPNPLTDTSWFIWPTFKGCIKDVNAGATMLCFAPSAGTRNGMYLVEQNYRPLTTIHLPLNPRGAASGGYESIVTNQPNDYYVTVTDANTDAVDFTFFVTNRMAGATTATFRLVGVSKNASPANNIALDCAMSTFTPGTDTYTAHVTTGEVRALLTPATQNRPVAVTTSSHTINGGPLVAGDIVKGSCEVHATDTTSTQLSDFRLEGVVAVTLEVNSFSE